MPYQKPLAPEDYRGRAYLNKARWISYHWQTALADQLLQPGQFVLEVGVGNSLVAGALAQRYQVETVDTNAALQPTYVQSVEDLSALPADHYDLVLCAEVLEHLPFEQFSQCLGQLRRVTKQYVIVSLPYWGYTFGWRLRLPWVGTSNLQWKLSGFKPHAFNGQHYWEIGKRGYPLRRVRQAIGASGLRIDRQFWDIDDPYHYYFVLAKV